MKRPLYLILVATLVAALLPVAALAAKPADIVVQVRNQTGAPVDLSLTDADGSIIYQSLPVGNSTFDLTEGRYTFFAATLCGNQSGPFNAVKGKLLFLKCDAAPVVMYENCQYVARDPYTGRMWDPGLMYRHALGDGYPYSYERFIADAWMFGYQEFDCIYGMQPSDYWDGVKPADTKPVWLH